MYIELFVVARATGANILVKQRFNNVHISFRTFYIVFDIFFLGFIYWLQPLYSLNPFEELLQLTLFFVIITTLLLNIYIWVHLMAYSNWNWERNCFVIVPILTTKHKYTTTDIYVHMYHTYYIYMLMYAIIKIRKSSVPLRGNGFFAPLDVGWLLLSLFFFYFLLNRCLGYRLWVNNRFQHIESGKLYFTYKLGFTILRTIYVQCKVVIMY